MERIRTPRTLTVVAAFALVGTLAGCSGGEKPVSEGQTPDEVMQLAKETLDETSGVQIDVSTDDLPDGTSGLVSASGVGNHQPAWEGTTSVVAMGTELEVPIISVDGSVYAELPFSSGYSTIKPEDYGAPDPAGLMATEGGFSDVLVATESLEQGEDVRGGEDNDEVLTEYTGTVPADEVTVLIPSASGEDFDVTYTIASNGELREAVFTGSFYPDSTNTYTLSLSEYGTESEIAKP